MKKYRKKPITVEAERLTERTEIETLEGTLVGNPGDWLITGVAGEKYPCKDAIFQATYETVENNDTIEAACSDCGRELVWDDPRREFPVLVCPACLYRRVQSLEQKVRHTASRAD